MFDGRQLGLILFALKYYKAHLKVTRENEKTFKELVEVIKLVESMMDKAPF